MNPDCTHATFTGRAVKKAIQGETQLGSLSSPENHTVCIRARRGGRGAYALEDAPR
eukprot:COSAG02_NODE_57677_length_280_cov_0.298343_1_plen_55_part_10